MSHSDDGLLEINWRVTVATLFCGGLISAIIWASG